MSFRREGAGVSILAVCKNKKIKRRERQKNEKEEERKQFVV
jgi:hypothetical protein